MKKKKVTKKGCLHIFRSYCVNCGTWMDSLHCSMHQTPVRRCIVCGAILWEEPCKSK